VETCRLILLACILVVGGLFTDAGEHDADRDLRAQLVSLQKETGLSLAYFAWNLEVLDFGHRNKLLAREELPRPAGGSQAGSLSPHGRMVAFAWLYLADDPSFSGVPHDLSRLGIVQRDGTHAHEFDSVRFPKSFCWSPDESRIAVYSSYPRGSRWSGGKIYIVNLDSGHVEEVATGSATLSPQCWSPDGTQLVYSVEDAGSASGMEEIIVYERLRKESRLIGKGQFPTWSSDGKAIAFLTGDDYYTVPPLGGDRKLFLHAPKASTSLLWSPDSRYVAYGVCCKYGWDVQGNRVYVRRLGDNAQIWVADVGYFVDSRALNWILPLKSRQSIPSAPPTERPSR